MNRMWLTLFYASGGEEKTTKKTKTPRAAFSRVNLSARYMMSRESLRCCNAEQRGTGTTGEQGETASAVLTLGGERVWKSKDMQTWGLTRKIKMESNTHFVYNRRCDMGGRQGCADQDRGQRLLRPLIHCPYRISASKPCCSMPFST